MAVINPIFTLSDAQCDDVSGIVARLQEVRAPIEHTFLLAGQKLGDAVSAIAMVTGAFRALCGYLDSDGLRESVVQLSGIALGLQSVAADSASGREALLCVGDHLQRLGAPLQRLQQIVREVGILAINARIEAAQIEGAGLEFTVFTSDIRRLGELAETALTGFASELDAVGALAATARASQAEFDNRQRSALPEIARRLEISLRAVEGRKTAAASAALMIRDDARSAEDRIGEIIMALQAGDITRQRIEHVERAIEKALCGESAAAGNVFRLQAMQISHAEEDLRSELDNLRSNSMEIRSDAEAIRLRGRGAFRSDGGTGESFLHEIIGDLRAARTLVIEYGQAADQLKVALGQVSGRLNDMVTHVENVRSIEADMRVMGLNATFRCSRLGGSGRALGVIAQELRSCARKTAEDAVQVMNGLQQTFSAAQALVADNRKGAMENILATLDQTIGTLAEGSRRLEDTLTVLDEGSVRTSALLTDVAAMFSTEDNFICKLAACAGEIGDAAATYENAGHVHADGVSQSYTMASERAVHARFLGQVTDTSTHCGDVSLDQILF